MKIKTEAIKVSELDNYEDDEFPLAIYTSKGEKLTKRAGSYLGKYYERVVDKRGNSIYYCSIINPHKCNIWKGASINGKLLQGAALRKSPKTKKYELLFRYSKSGKIVSAKELVMSVRGTIYEFQLGRKLNIGKKSSKIS